MIHASPRVSIGEAECIGDTVMGPRVYRASTVLFRVEPLGAVAPPQVLL